MLQVKLAKDARELAVVALQKEPTNDLAHHLMGRCATAVLSLLACNAQRQSACSRTPAVWQLLLPKCHIAWNVQQTSKLMRAAGSQGTGKQSGTPCAGGTRRWPS